MTSRDLLSTTGLELDYPLSVGVYDRYVDAQHAVDFLADKGFPVENLQVVGTELRSIERVTGRLTRGKVAAAGALSGFWIGLFVGLAFSLFSTRNQLGSLVTTPILGTAFGLVWGQLGYRTLTRHGSRDFASVNQVVATKYEVMVEHKFSAQAHELLATMPPSVSL